MLTNNQKGFASIALIVLAVILAGALGYVTLVKNPFLAEQSQTNNPRNTQQTHLPGNNTVVTPTPPPAQPPVAEADVKLTYPDGGEILNANQPISISYKVGVALKRKISSTDRTELYLLNSNNILVGYIGKFDVNGTQFSWNPQQLIHNGGLDTTSAPTPAGQYRILIVVRPPSKSNCTNCDVGVDTLDGPNISYSNGKLSNGAPQPIASDVSASLFTVK